jgi:uncharacterized protein
MNPFLIIEKYYQPNSDAYKILVKHSTAVAKKALQIAAKHPEWKLNLDFIYEAAMLHDVGIFLVDAPNIGCGGNAPYICHGYLGANLLRTEGLHKHALVCERHTGTGISLEDVQNNNLPLPHQDYQPKTWEEKIICFADKFYSKTHLDEELSVEKIKKKLLKHGQKSLDKFEEWFKTFSKFSKKQ